MKRGILGGEGGAVKAEQSRTHADLVVYLLN
jgi:hypothetical protein